MDTDKMEILKMARELVINEYTDMRAQMHNEWLFESDKLWKTRKVRLAYPPIPPYPTEKDILDRANKLLNFVNLSTDDKVAEIVKNIEKIAAPVEEVKPIAQQWEEAKKEVEDVEVIEDKSDSEKSKRLLGSILGKLEEIKKKI